MIHKRLQEVYNEFDSFCRINKIDYSIDADYYNVQGYRLLENTQIVDVLRHMANYVKDKHVNLVYDGFPVHYNELKSEGFRVSTHNPLFSFSLEAIQEETINEACIKSPNKSYTRKQAPFRSSFRRNKTRDTYENGGTMKTKKKKMKKIRKESFDGFEPFEDRLLASIYENVGISIVEPDILFTHNPSNEEDDEEQLESALKAESEILNKYLAVLESLKDEPRSAIIEELIEGSTAQIKKLNKLLKTIK